MTINRFAPSPTGALHLGHVWAAKFARDSGEKMLLRIEDIDKSRSQKEFVDQILEDLTWLGIQWDGPVINQSERTELYASGLEKLAQLELVYPCFCSRKDVAEEAARSTNAPQGPDGPIYSGKCRSRPREEADALIEAGQPYVVRLDWAKAAKLVGPLKFTDNGFSHMVEPGLFGDFVVARRDAPASYHLCVVIDDADQGVNLVTRGRDLLPSCHPQRLLQASLGLKQPVYKHHALVVDADGKRLAKRDKAQAVRTYREMGLSPEDLWTIARSNQEPNADR
ncbi:MAG: tRNA glutamyl-Q(34) synthetase GluQRS [Chthonomonadaceae bacterium]|nr:tRNA glutamyl-Q(34) synthetase GluQRS [Chthonomonadaceae bacterium]